MKTVPVANDPQSEDVGFRSQILVRFADCDYARMVFYPRYLVMFNNLVEDWFAAGLHLPFSELHGKHEWGVPTVHLEVDFRAPSFLGDILRATLVVTAVGRSSFSLAITLRGADGKERIRGKVVLVLMELGSNRSRPLPDNLRANILKFFIGPPSQEKSTEGTI
jgi:4-hydroxybenzoyl-CoA thioesterase